MCNWGISNLSASFFRIFVVNENTENGKTIPAITWKPEGKSVSIFGVPVTTAIKREGIFLIEMIADYYQPFLTVKSFAHCLIN